MWSLDTTSVTKPTCPCEIYHELVKDIQNIVHRTNTIARIREEGITARYRIAKEEETRKHCACIDKQMEMISKLPEECQKDAILDLMKFNMEYARNTRMDYDSLSIP